MAPLGKKAMARRKRNEDLLEYAMSGLHRDVARVLEEGADIEFQDRAGYTALSEAASAGHAIVAGQLLRAFADIDKPACDGRTPLHRAAFQNWSTVAKLLLDNGANAQLEDEDGKKAVDLARTGPMRELLMNFDKEKNEEAAKERQKKRAEMPQKKPEEDEDEDEKEKENVKAKEEEAKEKAFEPPARVTLKKEQEAKAKAEKLALRAERERKYQEALADIEEQYKAEHGEGAGGLAELPPPIVARVEVVGAGEERLNGPYRAAFATKERVEFMKEGDDQCQIVWTQHQDEWRMLIGDYKLGNTLYRNKYRPNIKADERLGAPLDGWQAWFGKAECPTIIFLADFGTPEYDAEVKEREEQEKKRQEEAEAREKLEKEQKAARAAASKDGKGREFLEFSTTSLDIVAPTKDPVARLTGAMQATAPKQKEVSLHGGERLVETADGLFSPGEVPEEEAVTVGRNGNVAAVEEVENSTLCQAFIDKHPDVEEVPMQWDAIKTAKTKAQELFGAGNVGLARQTTSAAINATAKYIKVLEDPGPDDEIPIGSHLPKVDELESFKGVLHSNRSLLLMQEIQAGDKDVLQFGQEAAWWVVAWDADKALGADNDNFKASFRRARALYELGEFEAALTDANRVVDHYLQKSSTPNPEAAALRDKITEAIQKERRKWGQRPPPRWNRGSGEVLVTEMQGATWEASIEKSNPTKSKTASVPTPARVAATPPRTFGAPRTGTEVETAMMKSDGAGRQAYLKEHLTAETLSKFFRRTPPGPDLLGLLVKSLAALAEAGDVEGAAGRLHALSKAPSATTQAAMLDADETASLKKLVGLVGKAGGEGWIPQADDDGN